MVIRNKTFLAACLLSSFSIGQVYAYNAPLESRNFDSNNYNQTYDSQSQYPAAADNNQPAYGYDERIEPSPQQLVSQQEMNQPGFISKLQRMEQEIRELRGQLEVQEHAINQLKDAQRNQYQDLDRRLSAGDQGNSMAASTNANFEQRQQQQQQSYTTPEANVATAPATAKQANTTNNNNNGQDEATRTLEEQKSYQQAYNLLRNKQYSQAIPAMNAYLTEFPKGKFAVNAHYWLGELYLLTGDNPQAKKQFQAVISNHPDSSKVPDSMLKLGFIDADEGHFNQARQQLNKITKEYPNTPAARLAEQRLQQIAVQGY